MTDSHFGEDGLWKAAREATRDDVRSVLAPRTRTCPTCGHVETGPGRACSACGAEFIVHRSRRPGRRVVLAVTSGLAVVAAAAAVIVRGTREEAGKERSAAAEAQARLVAAERARLRADVQPVYADGPVPRRGEDALAYRARAVSFGETTITADARHRVKEGTVDGPIEATQCVPYPKTQPRRDLEADPTVPRGRYECLAYNRQFELPELEGRQRTGILGTPYWLVVDYGTGRMTFCKVTPRAGEGGRSLASVPVPVPCRDPLRNR